MRENLKALLLFCMFVAISIRFTTGSNQESIECTADNAESRGRFYCTATGQCIARKWMCDGYPDCTDSLKTADDEHSCECTEEQFACGDGQCIDSNQKCNDQVDCKNGADEENCNVVECLPSTQMRCKRSNTIASATCVDLKWACDGENDCPDGDDELGCGETCVEGEFTCSLNSEDGTSKLQCIPDRWRCDGSQDCENGSDERSCDEFIHFNRCNNLVSSSLSTFLTVAAMTIIMYFI